MFQLSDLFKGILIGIANILPGISGGMLAVSMGVYDRIIHALNHMAKEPKKSLRTLFPYVLGAAIGIIGFSFSVEYLFTFFPLQTSLVFMGLILGGIPSIWKRASGETFHASSYLALLLTFFLITGLSFLHPAERQAVELTPSLLTAAYLIPVGILGAFTLIIPGISGSMILMMMGLYQPLIASVNQFLRSLAAFHLPYAWNYFLILAPFGIGILAGTFLCARLMDLLLTRFSTVTYCGVLGLTLSSPIVILKEIPGRHFTAFNLITGLLLFLFALWLTRLLSCETL